MTQNSGNALLEPTAPGHAITPRTGLSRWWPQLFQLIKFGAVGGVGVVVNLVVFNALLLTVFNPAHMAHGAILSTIVATLAAIAVNWVGNRFWAFSSDRQRNTGREAAEFLVASLIGMAVPLICVAFTEYVMGQHSLLAYNIANNVVGLVLGTLVRFVLYKFWVYSPRRRDAQSDAVEQASPTTHGVETFAPTDAA